MLSVEINLVNVPQTDLSVGVLAGLILCSLDLQHLPADPTAGHRRLRSLGPWAHLGLGPLGPTWALAHLGPGLLGPWAHLGPGPLGPWPTWALAHMGGGVENGRKN